jgi:hypothetical protein
MKRVLFVLVMLSVLCNVPIPCIDSTLFVPKTCEAFTPDRNLSNFGEVLLDDLRGLFSAEDWLLNWVQTVNRGEPIMWGVILIGGPIALQVMPKRTLQRYIKPMPLIPKALVNPQDVAKLKKILRTIDKNAGTWQRILRLFR